jgi:GTPase SAR1 family protein
VSSLDAIVYVIDSANHERFDESRTDILKLLKVAASKNKTDMPFAIMANKQDLRREGALTGSQLWTKFKIPQDRVKCVNLKIVESSAIDG